MFGQKQLEQRTFSAVSPIFNGRFLFKERFKAPVSTVILRHLFKKNPYIFFKSTQRKILKMVSKINSS
jgi:hypothetical protein